MATVAVLGTPVFNTTAGNKTITTTPTNGDLIVIVAAASGTTTTMADNATGGTYTQVDSTRTGFSTTGNLQVFVRDALVTGAASTIYTATQTGSTGGGFVILRVTGIVKTGASAVRSSGGQSTGTATTTPAPVLSATPLAGNPIITAVASANTVAGSVLVQRTGYTEDFDNVYSTPATALEVAHLASGETSATLTQGGTSTTAFASIAVEIDTSLSVNVTDSVTVYEGTVSLIDSYSETNQSSTGNLSSANALARAQSFTAVGGKLDSAKFYLKKTLGSPTGNATAKLYAHSGTLGVDGIPTGAALATSDNFDVSTLSSSFALTTLTFTGANKVSLTSGTNYFISFEYSGGDGSNRVGTGEDNTSPTHAGNLASFISGSWSVIAGSDLCFYVYSLGVVPEINSFVNKTDTATITENITVSIVGGGVADLSVNVSDSATLTESVTLLIPELFASVTDTTTITESTTRLVTSFVSVTDSPTITETPTLLETSFINVTDSPAITESTTQLVTSFINKTDSVTITETVTPLIPTLLISTSDTATITESTTLLETSFISVTDSPTISEAPTVTIAVASDLSVSVSDTATITESTTLLETSFVSVSDPATITESQTVYVPFYLVSVTDSPTITETTTRLLTSFVSVSDTGTITESQTLLEISFINVADTATITESTTRLVTSSISVLDTASITESTTLLIPELFVSSTDSTTITETTNQLLTSFINISDSPTITETPQVVTSGGNLSINVSDSIHVTESRTVFILGTLRKYYLDTDGNIYWVISQSAGLVERI
jgi:hypothetical protein